MVGEAFAQLYGTLELPMVFFLNPGRIHCSLSWGGGRPRALCCILCLGGGTIPFRDTVFLLVHSYQSGAQRLNAPINYTLP